MEQNFEMLIAEIQNLEIGSAIVQFFSLEGTFCFLARSRTIAGYLVAQRGIMRVFVRKMHQAVKLTKNRT